MCFYFISLYNITMLRQGRKSETVASAEASCNSVKIDVELL